MRLFLSAGARHRGLRPNSTAARVLNGSGWSVPKVVPQIHSGSHPHWVRYYDQTIFTSWREVPPPHRLHTARYDGPGFWSWFGPVAGATAGAAPAAARLFSSANLLLAWRHADPDTSLSYATFDSLHWSGVSPIAGAASSHGPALANFDGRLHMVWKGVAGDHSLYQARFDGADWTAPQQIPGLTTTSQPALATYGGRLILAYKGPEGDSGIHWSALAASGQPWLPASRISTFETGTGPALLEFAGRLHLLWKASGDDYSLFMANYDGSFWWPQHQIPGVASSSTPTLAEFDPAF